MSCRVWNIFELVYNEKEQQISFLSHVFSKFHGIMDVSELFVVATKLKNISTININTAITLHLIPLIHHPSEDFLQIGHRCLLLHHPKEDIPIHELYYPMRMLSN